MFEPGSKVYNMIHKPSFNVCQEMIWYNDIYPYSRPISCCIWQEWYPKSLSVGLKTFVIGKGSRNRSQKMVVLILKSLVKKAFGFVLMKIPISSLSGPAAARWIMKNCHMLPTRPHVFANWPLSWGKVFVKMLLNTFSQAVLLCSYFFGNE